MQTIVNATAALITLRPLRDRDPREGQAAARARSRARASWTARSPRSSGLEELLQWVFLSGPRRLRDAGARTAPSSADRPETEEKFRAVFEETGLRSFHAALLSDEEGKLGVLAFESKEPARLRRETRDLLQILVNQATVAVRNAQLYRQVPLVGFLKPLAEAPRKSASAPGGAARAWIAGIARRPSCSASSRGGSASPGRRGCCPAPAARSPRAWTASSPPSAATRATASPPARSIATLEGRSLRRRASPTRRRRSRSPRATWRASAKPATRRACSRPSRTATSSPRAIALAEEELARTRLTAPVAGSHRDAAHRGARRPVPAPRRRALRRRRRAARSRPRSRCPRRTPRSSPRPAGRAEDQRLPDADVPGLRRARSARASARRAKNRFLIAEVRAENPDGLLKTGMVGTGKVRAGRRSIATLLLRKPARWLWGRSGRSCPERRGPRGLLAARTGDTAAALAERHGAAGDRPGSPKRPRHPPHRPDGRGHLGGQEPGDDQVLQLRRRGMGPHPALRRHAHARRDPRGVPAPVPGRQHRLLARPRLRGDAPEDRPDRAVRRRAQPSAPRPGQDGAPARRRGEGRGPQHLLHPLPRPRSRAIPESDREVRALDLDAARRASRGASPPIWTVGIFVQHWQPIWSGTLELYAFLSKPLLDAIQFFLLLSIIGCIHEFAPRLRDEDLRRRGARHRHRPALLHAGLLLRHDGLAALREQVAPPLGRPPRGSTSRASSASRPRSLWVISYPDTLPARVRLQDDALHRASPRSSSTSTRSSRSTATTRSRACSRFRSCARSPSSTSAPCSRGTSCACPSRSPSTSRRKRRIFWIYGPLALAYIGVVMAFIGGLFFNFYSKYFPNLAVLLLVADASADLPQARPARDADGAPLLPRQEGPAHVQPKPKASDRGRRPPRSAPSRALDAPKDPHRHPAACVERSAPRGARRRGRRRGARERRGRRGGRATRLPSREPFARGAAAASSRPSGSTSRRRPIARAGRATRLSPSPPSAAAASVESELASDRARSDRLVVRSPIAGVILTPRLADWKGRHVVHGNDARRGRRPAEAARRPRLLGAPARRREDRRGGVGDAAGPAAAPRARKDRPGLGGDPRAARDVAPRAPTRPPRRRVPTDSSRGPSSTMPTARCVPA